MKKLLRVCLWLMLLVLSPQALQAKTKTVTFQGWRNENPELRYSKQLKGAATYYGTNNSWSLSVPQATTLDDSKLPTQLPEASTTAWPTSVTSASSSGTTTPFAQGCISWNDLQIDFNYNNCIRGAGTTSYSTSASNYNPNRLWGYTSMLTPATGRMSFYPGAEMKFSSPGKRIKKVVLHTPYTAALYNNAKKNSNLRVIDALGSSQSTIASTKATMTLGVDSEDRATITICSNELFGTIDGLYLKVNSLSGMVPYAQAPTKYYPAAAATEITKMISSATDANAAKQNQVVFAITSIDVEYYDEAPFNQTVTQSITDGFKYQDRDSKEWVDVAATLEKKMKSSSIIDKVKIGDFIVEVDSKDAASAYALSVRNSATYGLGIHTGTKFRIYPDPEVYKMGDGSAASVYKIKAYLSGDGLQNATSASTKYSAAYVSYNNANKSNFATEEKFEGSILFPSGTFTPNYVFEALIENKGMGADIDNWFGTTKADAVTGIWNATARSTSTKTADYTACWNGSDALMWIEKIEMVISTDVAPAPKEATVTTVASGQGASVLSDGKYRFIGSASVTPAAQKDDYTTHEIYYIISDDKLTDETFDKSKATKLDEGASISVNKKCFVNLRLYGVYSGGESAASVQSLEFEPYETTLISSYDELNKAENNGKIVTLGFFINGIANLTDYDINHNSAANGYYYHLYARDLHGNAMQITTLTSAKNSPVKLLDPISSGSAGNKFYNPGMFTGVFYYNDGRPELRLIDQKSENQYDFSPFIVKTITDASGKEQVNHVIGNGNALKEAGLTTAFDKNPSVMQIEKPSADNWGCFVKMRHLVYKEKSGNNYVFTDLSGDNILVDKAYIAANLVSLIVGTEYTVKGIVEYDDENDRYYLSPQSAAQTLLPPMFVSDVEANRSFVVDSEPHATSDDDVEISVDVALLSGKVNFSLSRKHQPSNITKDYCLQYVAYDMNNDGKKINIGNTPSAASPYLGSIESYALTWVDGMAHIGIKVISYSNTNTGLEPTDESDIVYIKLYDSVAYGLHVSSIADFTQEYADKTAADVTASTYVTLNFGEYTTPRYAVMGLYGKNMLMRDAAANADAQYLIAHTDLPKGWLEESKVVSGNGKVFNYKYHVLITSLQNYGEAYYRNVKPGDGIRSITGNPKNENGNWIFDVTDAADIFDAAGKSHQGDVAVFADELESFWEPMAAEVADVTDAKLNRLVRLEDVSVSRDGNYTIADGLSLAWKYLSDADKIASEQALINGASSTATFNVTGLVMRNGDKLAIEVVDLSSEYDRILEACAHESHDTYYKNQEFDAADNLVMVKGASISTDGGSYTILLKNNVALSWNNLAAQVTSHKALIDADVTTGETVTNSSYNISGFLTTGTDGTQTLDIVSLKQLAMPTGENAAVLTVLYNGGTSGNWGDGTEHFDGYVRITADVPAGTRVFMRAAEPVEVIYEETDDENTKKAKYNAARDKALDEAEEFVLTEETAPTYDKDMWIRLYSCTPGAQPLNVATKTLAKQSEDVMSVSEILANMKDNTGYNPKFHYRGTARVTNIGKDMVMLTDGDALHIGVNMKKENAAALTDGTYLKDFVLHAGWTVTKINPDASDEETAALADEAEPVAPAAARDDRRSPNSQAAYSFYGNVADWIVTTPEQEIASPEVTVAETVDFDSHDTRYVKLHDVKLTGSNAEGYMMTTSTGDEVEVNNMFVADLASTTPDKLYTVTGYVMKARKKANTIPGAAAEPLRPEFWVSAFAEKETTATPVFKLEGIESEAEGKAITIADVTVTLTCASEGAVISYSTDGGNNWVEYKNAPFKVTESKKIMAKATAPYMMESPVATMEIVRETISGKAAIDFAPKAGYTEVTLRHEAIDFAGKYEVRYTTDGSEPTADSQLYTAPLELEEACTVKAILKEEGKDRFGAVVSQAITVRSGDLKITATRAPGKTTVRIEVADTKHFNADGAVICYSKNDGATFEEYQVKDGKNYVEFETDKAITVVAYLEEQGKTIGEEVAEDITVDPVTTEPTDPTDPTDPTPAKSGKVTITATEGDGVTYVELAPESQLAAGSYAIHYTLDGSEPTAASTKHDGNRIEVRKACTIKAVLIENGKTAGEMAVKQIAVTGIDGIAADGAAKVTVEGDCIVAPEGSMVFDMTGRRVRPEGLRAGIYIVRLADGTAVKVAVR